MLKNSDTLREMKALLLSYLYLHINDVDVGAGDLSASLKNTGFSEQSIFFKYVQNLFANIFNELTHGNLPGQVLNLPSFFGFPKNQYYKEELLSEKIRATDVARILEGKLVPDGFPIEAIRNYIFLWRCFIKRKTHVIIYCIASNKRNCKGFDGFHLATDTSQKDQERNVDLLRKNVTKGYLMEGTIHSSPCRDNKTVDHFRIREMCNFLTLFPRNLIPFLKLMKYSIQSPVFLETQEEHLATFENANETYVRYGFMARKNKKGYLLGQPNNTEVWSRVREALKICIREVFF